MTVSRNSTQPAGQRLIEQLERAATVCTNRLNAGDYNYTTGDVRTIQAHFRNAVHRLRFLEMCVLGLTHGELEEARDTGQMIQHVEWMQRQKIDE